MYFIGGDIHKLISTFNVMNSKLKTVEEFVDIPTSEEGFRCITRRYNPKDCIILIETSTRSVYVQRFFHNAGYNILVGHAKDLRNINNSKVKTDRVDARKLAEYAKMYHDWEKNRPTDELGRPVRPPFRISRMTDLSEYMNRNMTRQMMRLTELASEYKKSIQEYMSAQNICMPTNFKSVDADRSVRFLKEYPDVAVNGMVQIMEDAMRWESDVETELKKNLGDDENVNLLMTIPGIDFKLASYFAMHIRDISDFDSPDELVSYFGMTPVIDESAHKRKSGRSITRDSSSKLRKKVYDAVRNHTRCCRNSDITKFELRMMHKIGLRSAEAAAGRKLVTVMWAMLTYREPFSPHPGR